MRSLPDLLDYVERRRERSANVYLYRGQIRGSSPRVPEWMLVPKLGRHSYAFGLREVERRMLEEFRLSGRPFVEIAPESSWDWLALAQHHTLPTRLLDWALNPLTAAWFATHKPLEGAAMDPAVIWVFEPDADEFLSEGDMGRLSPFNVRRVRVLVPSNVDARIEAQRGVFTVHPMTGAGRRARIEPMERVRSQCLERVVIPREDVPGIRYALLDGGVDAWSIFRSIDGLAQKIEASYSYAPDEL